MITVDSREPKAYRSIGDRVEFMEHGDYVVEVNGERMVFERKTFNDYFNSIKSFRLEEQLSHSDALIIDKVTPYWGMNHKTLHQSLNTVAMKMPVVYVDGPTELHDFLRSVEKKMESGALHTTELRKPVFTHQYKDPRIAFLTTLPHIGKKKAEAILEEFGDVASFMSAVLEIDADRIDDKRYIRSLRISNLQGFGIKIVRDLVSFMHKV